jgi:hypothetical protein
VRRVPHAVTAEKSKATGSGILPQTIQQHQKLMHRRKIRISLYLPCFGLFRRGSNGGRRTQIDQRRGRFGFEFGTYTVRCVLFDLLKVLAISICALSVLKKWGFLGTQEHLSRPIAVVIRTRTSHRSSKFYMPLPMESALKEEAQHVDYGPLILYMMEEDGKQRNIHHDFDQDLGAGDDDSLVVADDDREYYYAFDDDTKRNPYIGWDDQNLQNEKQCRRASWHRLVLLNCNSFHELGIASNTVADFKFKG